ncbi:EKC/KEOPS complex subunit LAGE3 [Desmodus rotundus]|uniref:EKC/KEOPS complex subunit LAGE3 n=1 Tax=Desmodus rotundus TaxID=9430 RepID=UPI001E1C0817
MVKFAPRGRGRRRSAAAMQAADAGTTGALGLASRDGCGTRRGADIARGSLAPDAEPHRDAIRKEFTVTGSVLAVCWRAEDAHLLRISIINFLDQLSLVIRTMQRFGPPVSR